MRFALLTYVVAGIGVANVAASPLRVLYITSTQQLSAPGDLRFGHAVASSPSMNIASVGYHHHHDHDGNHDGPGGHLEQKHRGHHRCGGRFRQKAIEISNVFRQALGLPLIATFPDGGRHHHHQHHGHKEVEGKGEGMYRILPFIGTAPSFVKVDGAGMNGSGPAAIAAGGGMAHILPVPGPNTRYHSQRASFMERLQVALMSLGSWEGRAVAFVLGCGLGVLIRMFFVLLVVSYRSVRGNNQEDEFSHIILAQEQDAEVIFAAPPSYPEEKAAATDADKDKKAPTTTETN